MRTMRLQMQLTTDGYAAGRQDDLSLVSQPASAEAEAYECALLDAADLLVLGRVTYQLYASYWPRAEANFMSGHHGQALANRMNNIDKLVLSGSLDTTNWCNCSLLNTDIVSALRALKEQPGRDIVVAGGIKTARGLLDAGLVDELNLLVIPFMLGQGRRLFNGLNNPLALRLLDSRVIGSGIVVLNYRIDTNGHLTAFSA